MTTVLDTPSTARAESAVTAGALRRQSIAALRLLLVLTVILGLAYPFGVWAVSRIPGLHTQAEGSVTASGASSLIGIDPTPANPAADPWFHTRPSASSQAPAGLGPADPSATSGGSNLGPTSATLRDAVAQRRAVIAAREGVAPAAVPPDALTASGSGVDPDISVSYALLQAPRVARVTGLGQDRVRALVAQATDRPSLGFLDEPGVNVPILDALVHAAAPGAR